jgi:hypothetical protein
LPPWPTTTAEQEDWQQLANTRRFAWAALYRIDNAESITSVSDPREFTFSFFTLRRTQGSHRFPRQLDQGDAVLNTQAPRALGAVEDMAFAVPWLVNLKVVGAWDASGSPEEPLGLPSEAIANPTGTAEGRLIAQMLPPGAYLVDRLTGAYYRVTQRVFTGSSDDSYDYRATLTLDREILAPDVDTDLEGEPGHGVVDGVGVDSGFIDDEDEDSRDFWVFPPPVDRAATASVSTDDYPVFDGKQPVVAIETRQITIAP